MKRDKPMKMVGWYDPWQLIQTAQHVVVSTIFGENADFRVIEALSAPEAEIHDFSRANDGTPRNELWIDYVADAGDGWNSTYAIAECVAQRRLVLTNHPDPLGRGAVLVFGGDEVYPAASRKEYERRLVDPYECALKRTDPPNPQVFAIPGNHDWYDSLVSFTRLFCGKDWFAGWRAPQSRSYFALQLPHRWWLIGLDMQLESDIDPAQVAYFENVAARMAPNDRIVLCNAEPYWIYDHIYGERDPEYRDKYLHYTGFIEKHFGDRVRVLLAGDLHHYRRHAATSGTESKIQQKITAGGGGAFLHPTHGPDTSVLKDGYKMKCCFPTAAESFKLSFRNLSFPLINPKFGMLTAALYFLLAWSAQPDIGNYPLNLTGFFRAAWEALRCAVQSPAAASWPILTVLGFWLFTDTHRFWYRLIAAPLHAFSHLGAALWLYWLAAHWSYGLPGLRPKFAYLIVPIGGYLLGPVIMGIYLLVSLDLFGRHSNEAFSSLAIDDWKSFLKIKVDEKGLTIYPIGIRRVTHKWKSRRGSDPCWVPDDNRASAPELIEEPITVT